MVRPRAVGTPHRGLKCDDDHSVVSADQKSPTTRRWPQVLPKGWPDFLLQLFLFAMVDVLYEVSRTLARADLAAAFVHARDVVSIEQTLGIFTELDVQQLGAVEAVACSTSPT